MLHRRSTLAFDNTIKAPAFGVAIVQGLFHFLPHNLTHSRSGLARARRNSTNRTIRNGLHRGEVYPQLAGGLYPPKPAKWLQTWNERSLAPLCLKRDNGHLVPSRTSPPFSHSRPLSGNCRNCDVSHK